MTGDALRNTLDHLALDPNSGADRHYLVTVLRRLGYTEREIREVLGDEGEEGRVIEVEYTGKGATFLFGKPGATQKFTVADSGGQQQFTLTNDEGTQQFTLVDDPEAGVETFEGVDLDDVDVSDDWGDWDDDGGFDEVPDDFEDADTVATDDEELVTFKEASLVQFKEKESELVPFNMEGEGDGWTEVDAPDAGWSEVDDEWAIEDAPGDAWEPVEEETVEWAEAEPEEAPFTYDDYTLYTRPVELTTGKTQHIYFFAKDEPKSGEPCPLPDGYEVGVSEKTGLPFLRKSDRGASSPAAQAREDYPGDVHQVVDLEGIGPTYEKKLHDAGITNTQELLFTDDDDLADITGAPPKTVQNWKHMSQLVKIKGVGPQFAELMVRAGIEGIDGLRDGDPESMVAQVKAYEAGLKNQVTGSGIGIKRMTTWHEEAKGMQKEPIDLDAIEVLGLESRAALRDADSDGGHPKVRDPAEARDGPSPLNDEHVPGQDGLAPGKRVRVRRVAAEDAESAREQIRREGGDVRGVVPIRIEEHEDE